MKKYLIAAILVAAGALVAAPVFASGNSNGSDNPSLYSHH